MAIALRDKIEPILPNINKYELTPMQGSFPQEKIIFNDNYIEDIVSPFHEREIDYEFNPQIVYPVNSFSLSPGIKSHIGSPAGFYFGNVFLGLNFSSVLAKNFEFESIYTLPMADNFETLSYDPSYTDVYPVRIEVQEYLKKGKYGFDRFLLNYFNHLAKESYAVFSVGHFEQMYSGARFEYLKHKVDSIFSYGFEVSRVRQRDYSKSFLKFKDYSTTTGHINFYAYEPFLDFTIHASVGKYLAKDYGATFEFSKLFPNGLEMGFFFTLTNLSAGEYGEGSFDKGIFFTYPISLFASGPKKGKSKFLYRPLTRDGGSKLDHNLELYEILKTYSKVVY